MTNEMYQLKIEIKVGNHEIWRKVIVPDNMSFYDLHCVIQKTFDWLGYHKHEFYTIDERDFLRGDKAICDCERKIVMVEKKDVDNELLKKNFDVRDEKAVDLKDIFSKTDKCIYHYDFDDNWFHFIRLEKIIKDNDEFKVRLLDRKGERPPEGIGGERGFLEYFNVISDKNHPFREQMLEWADGMTEKKQSISEINEILDNLNL